MKPLYGDACLGCKCLACLYAAELIGRHGCACCEPCAAHGEPRATVRCTDYTEPPAA